MHLSIYLSHISQLAGPLLFVMPEPDAFFAFVALLRRVPRYTRGSLRGVHHACRLVGEVMREVDPELSSVLEEQGLIPKVYAFSVLMSFLTSVPPLVEVLRVWDVLLAFGM